MKVLNVEQGTEQWLQARAGLVTASRMSDVLAKLKSGDEAASRRDYKAQIVAEILTGAPVEERYYNAEMQWGNEQEPFARAAYEVAKGVMVDQVGFVLHEKIARTGASPDGLVEKDGMVELKCPKTATHLSCLLKRDDVPPEYVPQMMWQIACAGRKWCDFVSFDPRLPEKYQLFIVRLKRDDERIAEMEKEVKAFLAEVDAMLLALGATQDATVKGEAVIPNPPVTSKTRESSSIPSASQGKVRGTEVSPAVTPAQKAAPILRAFNIEGAVTNVELKRDRKGEYVRFDISGVEVFSRELAQMKLLAEAKGQDCAFTITKIASKEKNQGKLVSILKIGSKEWEPDGTPILRYDNPEATGMELEF